MAALIVFAICAGLAGYILAGYPLLLAYFPFREGPPIRKDSSFTPTVSLILAVRNGEAFIRKKLESILALDYPRELLEILIVSDGSVDRTEAIVEEFAAGGVKLIRRPALGKASALNAALEQARGEILFFTDVRQMLDPLCLRKLAASFADPAVGAVTGEMRLHKPEIGEQADMDLYWRYEVWVRTKHSSLYSLFNTTGCIYAMRRQLAVPLSPDIISDDAMLPLTAFFRGYRVLFEPEALAFDLPAVAGSEFRRRLRNLAGLLQVHVRMKALFTSKNRMRLHFLSHKFSRLALPWILLSGGVSTLFFPPSTFKTAVLAAEASVVLLVLCDPLIPSRWVLKRIASPARTFAVMNAAALLAPAVFFISPQRIWKQTQVHSTVTAERER
jgi:biofilm PGA synthesis N-glycosyltransferase PgaC